MRPSQGSWMLCRLVKGLRFSRPGMGQRGVGRAGYDWELQANVYELGPVMTVESLQE